MGALFLPPGGVSTESGRATLQGRPQLFGDGLHVLVAAAAEADEDSLVRGEGGRQPPGVVDGVGRLQRRDYALCVRQSRRKPSSASASETLT